MRGLALLLRRSRALLARAGSTLRICYLRAAFPNLSLGFDSFLGPGCDVYVDPTARMVLRNVVIGRGCVIRAGPGALVDIRALIVGPNSTIVARERITIAEESGLAEMTVVRDSDNVRADGAMLVENRHTSSPIAIGRNV
jgi:acetyltransferase-like isoleucine patch superfamily enzyme